MLDLKTPDQVRQYVLEKNNAAALTRQAVASRTGTDECYYEGVQYLQAGDMGYVTTTSGRLPTTINPDSSRMRVVWNEMTRRILKSAGQTWPSAMEVVIDPPIRDGGVEASYYSQVMEDLYQAWIRKSNFLNVARQANHRRCISGMYGLILRLVTGKRVVGMDGQPIEMDDLKLEVEDFHPLRLLLDPAVTHRDLRKHDEIVFYDIWTANKIRRAFPGMQFDESQMKTVGALTSYEQNISELSGGKLFGRYRQYSQTKGARVYQVHAKGPDGNFTVMYSAVEINGGSPWQCPNLDNPVSPFGGDGLPMVLLHGHQRADSPYSLSDVSMGKDAQDMLNIAMTQHMRAAQKYTGYNIAVDKSWLGPNVNDEDARAVFSNRYGGIWLGKPRDRNSAPPTIVQSPAPSPHLLQMVELASSALLDSVFRSELDLGVVKSHTADRTNQRAFANSGQILGIRVEEDLYAYSQLGIVALGTIVSAVQSKSPSMLAMCDEEGFDEQDLATIMQADPKYPTCNMTISSSSIRYRSPDEVKASLMELATMAQPAIDPPSLRKALADLDMPVSEDDKHMRQEIGKAITLLLRGQPWEPLPLGPEYGKWCITELERALFDRKARNNPSVRALVAQALTAQQQIMVQQQIQSDPNLVVQQQQAAMQAQQQAQQPPEQEQEQQPQNIGDMIDQLAASSR